MLITMKKNVGLHIVDEVVRNNLEEGFSVYIMRKKRPIIIAVFGNGADKIQKSFGMESLQLNCDFFRDNRADFEEAGTYLSVT